MSAARAIPQEHIRRFAADDNLHGTINYSYDALGNLRNKTYTSGQYEDRTIELDYYPNNRLRFTHDRDGSGQYAYTGKRWTKQNTHGSVSLMGTIGGPGYLYLIYDMTQRPVTISGNGLGTNGASEADTLENHLYDGHNRRVKSVKSNGAARYNIFDGEGRAVGQTG